MTAYKKTQRTFTFEITKDFEPTFERFQELATLDERATSAFLRYIIRQYVDDHKESK